jgi:predicted dehydrogenase
MDMPFVWHEGKASLMYYPQEGDPSEVPFQDEMLYLGEVEDLHAALLDGAAPYLTLEESRNHVRTIVALYESARTGKEVSLD